jgi:hypothetical protein
MTECQCIEHKILKEILETKSRLEIYSKVQKSLELDVIRLEGLVNKMIEIENGKCQSSLAL